MMKVVYEQSVTRADALREMRERWEPAPRSRVVGLSDACGRVTSEEVRALHSLPVKRSSKRDGIAVRSTDFAAGAPDTSSWTRDVDFAQADTGDDFPDAFDAVIAVEHIAYDEHGGLHIVEEPPDLQSGSGVNPCGSIVRAGDVLVAAHTRLTPELVASLAVGGHAQVRVLERPRVAFIPTGSELVPFGAYPQRGQNIEANSLLVSGMVRAWGAEVTCYPVVRDDEEALEAALDRALEAADIVLINGGSSRGEEDFNARLLERRGSYFRHGVRAVPGRPVGMALIEGRPVINVPGPVLAAFLSLDWLVRGLVAQFLGVPVPRRRTVRARLSEPVAKPEAFERLVRVSISGDATGEYVCTPLPQPMTLSQTLRSSDGMLTLPIGSTGAQAGEEFSVELLRPLELIEASWEEGEGLR